MDTNKSIISLSHNDLDGVGCQVVLRWQFGDVYFKSISYSKIIETFNDLDSTLSYDRSKTQVIISDLALKDDEIELLKSICIKYPDVKFIIADHHLRSLSAVKMYETFPNNFIDLHNENRCSAMILFYYYGINNIKIRDFIHLVNVYDLWIDNDSKFEEALLINEIYESMLHSDFFAGIGMYGNLKDDITRKTDKTLQKIQSIRDSIDNNEMIFVDDKLFIAQIDRYKSIVQYYLKRDISIIISSNFNFSIRLSNGLKDYELLRLQESFFDFFKREGYDYYHAHKQVFGFNSSEEKIIDDIDIFIAFTRDLLTK